MLDADGPAGQVEAFVVCDDTWQELARCSGREVFDWGPRAWLDARLWCGNAADLRLKRPGRFDLLTLCSVLHIARERGFGGPDSVAALADWGQVPYAAADLSAPLGRCLLLAAVLRAPALRGLR